MEKNANIHDYDYLISIENSLKIQDNEIIDFVNVCVKNLYQFSLCVIGWLSQIENLVSTEEKAAYQKNLSY